MNKIWLRKFELISAASGIATVALFGWTIWDTKNRSKIDNLRLIFETDPHVIVDLDSSSNNDCLHVKNAGKGAVCDVLVSIIDNFDLPKKIGIYGFFHPGNSFITCIKLEEIRQILGVDEVPENFKLNFNYYSPYNKNYYSQNFAIQTKTKEDSPTVRVVKFVTPKMRTETKKV